MDTDRTNCNFRTIIQITMVRDLELLEDSMMEFNLEDKLNKISS